MHVCIHIYIIIYTFTYTIQVYVCYVIWLHEINQGLLCTSFSEKPGPSSQTNHNNLVIYVCIKIGFYPGTMIPIVTSKKRKIESEFMINNDEWVFYIHDV